MKMIITGIMGLLFIICSTALFSAGTADFILFNGKVITVNAGEDICQAVAIQGDQILATGTDTEILALASPFCKKIDLQGKTVTPGLIDSHYHLMYYGAQFWSGFLNIRHPVVTSKADLLQVVGDYTKGLNPGEWISANQGFTLQAYETVDRWDLDTVAPENPAYLRHSSGQYSAVNSRALDIAGIDSSTPNPPGSLILHNEKGDPTGILSHYPAENLVGQYAPGYGQRSVDESFDNISRGQELCLEAGYTSVQDVIVGSVKDIMLYKQFADSGLLKVRLYTMLYLDSQQEADTLAKVFHPANSGRFTFGGWKLAMDGGPAARTTLMYDKNLYAAQISYPYHTQEELNQIVQVLHNTGLQVAVHVGGDEGIDMTLTAFEQAQQNNPRPDARHRIEHGLFPTETALQRMQANAIILSTQPQWITWYGDGYTEATNATTMNRFLPLKTMLDQGIHLAFGCDVPASPYQEPQWAFRGAILRRTVTGNLMTPGERLTMREALRIHTLGSAYAGFAETTTGSLEPGKFADLVIWSHDLYNLTPTDLNDLASEMTIVGGEIVFDAGKIPVILPTDHWVTAGQMQQARQDHGATLLPDGKVLIIGWESQIAELYDPVSDTFTEIGNTIYLHRQGATVTLLHNNQVLIAGGTYAQQSAELYDPATGNFRATGNLNRPHCFHTATLFPDGRVLIVAGQNLEKLQTNRVCEIFDPQTGIFTLTDSLKVDRSTHTASLLENGKVLVVGGMQTTTPGNGQYIASCELYDPITGTFSEAQRLMQPRMAHTATVLANGKVFVACGSWYYRYGELYDPATNTWSQTGDMTRMRRNYHTATLLRNGKVLLAGGFIERATNSAELYDPLIDTFTAVDSMKTPRMEHTATLLQDGSVLVTGGYSTSGAIALAERYLVDTTRVVRIAEPVKRLANPPNGFRLLQNYPNPFNPATTIQFQLPEAAPVELVLFNMLGRQVRILANQRYEAGIQSVNWDGLDDAGQPVSVGVYMCRMTAKNFVATRKILLLK